MYDVGSKWARGAVATAPDNESPLLREYLLALADERDAAEQANEGVDRCPCRSKSKISLPRRSTRQELVADAWPSRLY